MGWFGRKERVNIEVVPPGVRIVGITTTDSQGNVTEHEINADTVPITDARLAEIYAEMDEFKARREAARAAGQYEGRHFVDWFRDLDQLRKDGKEDEHLARILDMIPIAFASRAAGGDPQNPGLHERAAIILHRRGQYAREVELLESYLADPRVSGLPIRDSLARRLARARASLRDASHPKTG